MYIKTKKSYLLFDEILNLKKYTSLFQHERFNIYKKNIFYEILHNEKKKGKLNIT